MRVRPLVGQQIHTATEGRNAIALRGRFAGRLLRPGTYRLTVTPSADNSTGRPTAAGFEVLARGSRNR